MVPLLPKRIAAWAESSRGKLAEYAMQAMALLGTDVALSAVNRWASCESPAGRNHGPVLPKLGRGSAVATTSRLTGL